MYSFTTQFSLLLFHSILALMHRVIDDVDAEWALESFQGYRWDPCTRPRYTVGVPTRI